MWYLCSFNLHLIPVRFSKIHVFMAVRISSISLDECLLNHFFKLIHSGSRELDPSYQYTSHLPLVSRSFLFKLNPIVYCWYFLPVHWFCINRIAWQLTSLFMTTLYIYVFTDLFLTEVMNDKVHSWGLKEMQTLQCTIYPLNKKCLSTCTDTKYHSKFIVNSRGNIYLLLQVTDDSGPSDVIGRQT